MVKCALRDPAKLILCHGCVCSGVWPPHTHRVGAQENGGLPRSATVDVRERALLCCSCEGCHDEASPCDRF